MAPLALGNELISYMRKKMGEERKEVMKPEYTLEVKYYKA